MRARYFLNYTLLAVLAGLNLVCLNLLLREFRGARVDLTEGKIYSLAQETKELLREPEEPLEIYFFHSSMDKLHEKLRPIVPLLSDTLREFEAASEGKVTTRVVEWDSADKATQTRATDEFGVRPQPILVQSSEEEGIRNTYLSVVVAYGDQHEKFEHSQLYRIVQVGSSDFTVELLNVEYLVAKAIHKVIRGFTSIGAALVTNDLKGNIDLYFTPEDTLPKNLKKVPALAEKVVKKLAAESLDRLTYSVKDPSGDTPDKKSLRTRLKRQFGVSEIALDFEAKSGFYSWAVVTVGEIADRVPLIAMGEDLSEADIKDRIQGSLQAIIPGFFTTIGIVTPDPPANPMARAMGQQEPPSEFRELSGFLSSEFDVRPVDLKEGKPISRQIAALLLIRPDELSDKALYELDQFLMRGGRLVVCADAFCFDLERAMSTRDVNVVRQVNLGKTRDFLRHFGADVGDVMVMDSHSDYSDFTKSKSGGFGGRDAPEYFRVKNPFALFVESESIDHNHPITSKQQILRFNWATPISLAKEEPAAESRPGRPGVPAGVTGKVLAWSSRDSSTTGNTGAVKEIESEAYRYRPPSNAAAQPLVVALQGVFPSYFADRPVPGTDNRPDSRTYDDPETRPAQQEESTRLKKSPETSIVVIGDSDAFSPLVATRVFNVSESALNENLALLRNSIDFGGPDTKLLAIRGRERVQRPLTALRALDADARKDRTESAKWWSALIPAGVLIIGGIVWVVIRQNRRPIALPARAGGAS